MMTGEPAPVPMTAQPTDRELSAALAGGDRRAAERLVERTYRRIYRALFRMTGGDAELAADLTQDTYRRAWASLDSFEGRASFATWAYRIAYTTYLNYVRRPRRLTPLTEEAAAAVEDPQPGPERSVRQAREAERLRRAVLDLPEDLRFTVTAHYWGELTPPQIARQIGLSAVAVRKRLKRARTLLEAALSTDPEDA